MSYDFEEKKKALVEKERARELRLLSDIRKVLSIPEGRRFVWRLLCEAGVFNVTFTGNSETFFREGRRALGLFILNDVWKAKPEAFTQMQREAAADQKAENQGGQNQ